MDMFPEGTFLIGDGAYQSRTWMLTPYTDRTTLKDYQAKYNYVQSATRNTIERAFAMLKGRFNRLKHINLAKMSDVCLFIIAACTTHNFCIAEKESVDFNIELEEEINEFMCMGSSISDAERRRDTIAKDLFESCN